tara:strand:- start:1569 stop:2024 length:456 start_codon:yes stop_codon:yes gene_type:complete
MFRRKKASKSPNTIQEVLNDAWLESESGIITNLPYAKCMGTSGQGGNLRVDYATLKKVFGKPSINNGNGKGSKIRKEWIISIDGVVCTIYDWKQGYDYTKPKGGMPLKETRWSVGGSHRISFRLVQGVIDSYLATGILPKVVRLEGDIWEG